MEFETHIFWLQSIVQEFLFSSLPLFEQVWMVWGEIVVGFLLRLGWVGKWHFTQQVWSGRNRVIANLNTCFGPVLYLAYLYSNLLSKIKIVSKTRRVAKLNFCPKLAENTDNCLFYYKEIEQFFFMS